MDGSYRQFSNLYAEKETYQYLPDSYSFTSSYDVYTGNDSKIIAGNFVLKYFLFPQLEQKFRYTYQKNIEGSPVMTELWKAFPQHQFGWFLNYQPYNNFGISANLKYTSATDWTEYQYAVFQSNSMYTEKIKPKIIVDMAVQKWFLGKTIWTSLVIKNIFNQPEYYNPIGASANLRFYFQVHVNLNSLPE
jgi:outer membrane receptor for ferrienterochelin and colicin